EDGIRDDLVTGVQTCALPICLVGLAKTFHFIRPTYLGFARARIGSYESSRCAQESQQGKRPAHEGFSFKPGAGASAWRVAALPRSEERRVGKECRSGWGRGHG